MHACVCSIIRPSSAPFCTEPSLVSQHPSLIMLLLYVYMRLYLYQVLAVVDQLEQGYDLNVKDYTTLLAALKRYKSWKVRVLLVDDDDHDDDLDDGVPGYHLLSSSLSHTHTYV